MVRRLVFVAILVIGIALALSQFAQIKRLATGILASSAVLGLVFGLAARQTLGNMVAGVMLAIAQPIRIGDRISFEEVTGRVDDLTLSYTYHRPRRRRPGRDPEREDGQRHDLQPLDRRPGGAGHGLGLAAGRRPTSAARPRSLKADAGADGDHRRRVDPGGDPARGPGRRRSSDRTRVGDEEAALRERAQRALQSAGLLCRELIRNGCRSVPFLR